MTTIINKEAMCAVAQDSCALQFASKKQIDQLIESTAFEQKRIEFCGS